MPQILECRIGQEKYQKKGNLAPERGKKFVFLCLPPSSYDLSQSCRVVAPRDEGSLQGAPSPNLVLSPFPVDSSGIQRVMGPVSICAKIALPTSGERDTRLNT